MKKRLLAMTLALALCIGLTVPAFAATNTAFSDVDVNAYYAEPVKWAVENNVTAGTGDNMFSPDQTCTTAQILSFFWRASGKPEPMIQNPFSDISSSDYYYEAALWAFEMGLVDGKSFNADTPCTRSTTMTYFWKMSGKPESGSNSFTDVPNNADYAQAVAWAVTQGITSGTGNNAFSPDATCTRAQIVSFLYRYFVEPENNSGTSEPVDTTGTKETFDLEHNGVKYGTITVSSFLSSNRSEFNFGNGDIRNWSYGNVSTGGLCTITPSDAGKYCVVQLTAWKEESGVYSPVRYESSPWHKLYADGQAADLAYGDALEFLPLATSGRPAYFTFGDNMNVKSPFDNDTSSFVLKADGTMYRLDVDFYNESGASVASFIWPFFIK